MIPKMMNNSSKFFIVSIISFMCFRWLWGAGGGDGALVYVPIISGLVIQGIMSLPLGGTCVVPLDQLSSSSCIAVINETNHSSTVSLMRPCESGNRVMSQPRRTYCVQDKRAWVLQRHSLTWVNSCASPFPILKRLTMHAE